MEEQRKFKDGDIVIAGYTKLEMKVVSAELCLKGWKYCLGFMNKDGSLHKTKHRRFFWQEEMIGKLEH